MRYIYKAIKELRDLVKLSQNYKDFIKKILNLNLVYKIISYFKVRKYNVILNNSNHSEYFFKKYLRKYYNQTENIKNIFYLKSIYKLNSKYEKKELLIDIINTDFREFKKRVIKQANNILDNKFKIFEKNHKFNDKIDWNFSFFQNEYWPLIESSKINFETKKTIKDIKYNWEFNRHDFFVSLGLAYYLTEEKKYSEKLKSLFIDWIEKNPPLYGPNWISCLEIALRINSWIISLYLIEDSELLSIDIFNKIFKSMFQQVFFLRYNFKKRSFNHTIGEQFGIFVFSLIFKKIKVLKDWHSKSQSLFLKQISRQTLSDGVHIEKSLNYHRFVLEFFSLIMIISPNILNQSQKSLINKMYSFLRDTIKPDSSIPLIGDFDDGHLIPSIFFYSSENHNQYKELLSLGSILFSRGDLKFICEDFSPMTLLFLGKKSYDIFKNIKKKAPNKLIHYYNASQYFLAKNNYTRDGNFLLFDMAEFGPGKGGHDHLDFTNIIYSYKGKPILIDSGTYRYNDTLNIRNIFRGYKAHNVLEIENESLIRGLKNFGWDVRPTILKNVKEYPNKIKLKATHNSFRNFITSRELILLKDLSEFELIDTIFYKKLKNKEFKINIYFHFSEKNTLRILDNQIIINDELELVLKENKKKKYQIVEDQFLHSPNYGNKNPIHLIIFTFYHRFSQNKPFEVKFKMQALNHP